MVSGSVAPFFFAYQLFLTQKLARMTNWNHKAAHWLSSGRAGCGNLRQLWPLASGLREFHGRNPSFQFLPSPEPAGVLRASGALPQGARGSQQLQIHYYHYYWKVREEGPSCPVSTLPRWCASFCFAFGRLFHARCRHTATPPHLTPARQDPFKDRCIGFPCATPFRAGDVGGSTCVCPLAPL